MATNTYASAMNLANQVNPVNYDELKNQITSANTAYTPKYQDTNTISQITQDYMKNLQPVYDASANKINQNYDVTQNQGLQFMADKGLSRSGANFDNLSTNNQNRNNALNEANANLTQQAVSNATNVANLGLSEQNQVQNQKNTAVSQLSDLLSQYNNAQQQNQQNQYTEAGLTGNYGGAQTLPAQQLASQIASANAGLTGTYNGQQTLDAQNQAATIAYNQQQQKLAQLQALLSYNLGVGGITDNLPTTSGFTYGDSMTQLLKQLGLA
jgi:hypothetical protein